MHNVDFLCFFCHSDFTWNQLWSLWSSKTCLFDQSKALNSEFLNSFDIFKREIPKKLKFKASIVVKWQFFNLSEISRNWFYVKSEWQKKLLNFHTVEYPKSKFPIRVLRSVVLQYTIQLCTLHLHLTLHIFPLG